MFLLAENANKRFKVNLRDVPAFLISGSPVNSSPERRWFGPHWLVLGPGSGCSGLSGRQKFRLHHSRPCEGSFSVRGSKRL